MTKVSNVETTIKRIGSQFEADLGETRENGGFDDLYLKYFSKTHGLITNLIKELPNLSEEDKKIYGPAINELQQKIKEKIEEARNQYQQRQINDPRIDLTLPLPPKK